MDATAPTAKPRPSIEAGRRNVTGKRGGPQGLNYGQRHSTVDRRLEGFLPMQTELVGQFLALADRFYTNDGTRKPDDYFKVYAQYLGDMRHDPINMLELGVSSGASLLLWRSFFSRAVITGLDISPQPPIIQEAVATGALKFVQGDQSNPADLDRALSASGQDAFDVIIDDASHVAWLSRASFDHLFHRSLKPGGYYIVEDYATGFIPSFFDGSSYQRPSHNRDDKVMPSHQSGMVGWLKQLVDEMHADVLLPKGSPLVPIEWMHFFPHIVVIRKKA